MFATPFLDIPPLTHAEGEITLPGSKSISNRVLLLAALCAGTTTIHDLLDSDDTRVMLQALRQLGCVVENNGAMSYRVVTAEETPTINKMYIGTIVTSGSAIRFAVL